MDIKYIGSGVSAKAVIFYITDYITKSQLQAHVAYAALELAYKKLEYVEQGNDDITLHAKRLLQKCVYALISHQEMSAQQVVSYLMDLEDHFTSHRFMNIVWLSFEAFVNKGQPSPECYPNRPNDDQLQPQGDIERTDVDDVSETQAPSHQLYDSEITIQTTAEGSVVPKVSAVEDYVHHGPLLADLSVWDYFSRIEKTRKSADRQKHRKRVPTQSTSAADDDSSDEESTHPESRHEHLATHETVAEDIRGILWDWHFHPNPLLINNQRRRPRVSFLPQHSEHILHHQKV